METPHLYINQYDQSYLSYLITIHFFKSNRVWYEKPKWHPFFCFESLLVFLIRYDAKQKNYTEEDVT